MGRRNLLVAAAVAVVVALVGCDSQASLEEKPAESAGASGGAIASPADTTTASPAVEVATTFIGTLSGEQRAAAVMPLEDSRRPNWSNLPAGSLRFERNGVRIGDLDLEQIDAMHHFLASALSPEGYRTVLGIVRAEDALAESRASDRSRWSSDNYWLAFFGEPSEGSAWGWQFGGHHLAVNVTVVDGRSYLSPTFLGIEPASYTADGSTVAPLDPYVQAGLALINALDDEARARVTIENQPGLMAGAGRDGVIPELEGAAAGDWSEERQALLLDAIGLWVGVLDRTSAQARMEEIRSELSEIHFAWNGDVSGGGPIYFRIQGPNLIIEFSTERGLGGGGAHYHSIYRNPGNEYGSGILAWS